MVRIDAHQHFWKYKPERDTWISNEMKVIAADFLPQDLQPILDTHKIDGCIAVQSCHSEEDNVFLLELAKEFPFIKGVVGWVDLTTENIEERLEFYKGKSRMKGFRHILQGEKDAQFMLKPRFKRGISFLQNYNFSYDILISASQLKYAEKLIAEFPNQLFILDHIAKPAIKERKISPWKEKIEAISNYSNVCCKVSGMVTEADWYGWKKEDFAPYLDIVFNCFGIERLLFGSDWPVCNLAGGYSKALNMIEEYTLKLTPGEQALFWGENAIKFYKL